MTTEEINELARIERILENSGFHGVGFIEENGAITGIQMEDPGCIFRSFEVFLEFAWIVLAFITGVLLAGWAWAMIRGSKNAELKSIANNLKNLLLIFCTLTIAPFVINAIYGKELFKREDGELVFPQCKHFQVPYDTVKNFLSQRKSSDADKLFEYLDWSDSALDTPTEQVSLPQESDTTEPQTLELDLDTLQKLHSQYPFTEADLEGMGIAIDDNGNFYYKADQNTSDTDSVQQ